MVVACEWGINGLRKLARPGVTVVVVDVLSFSTAVDVAVSRGVSVFPYSGNDMGLREYARSVGAEAGVRRGEAGYSLSPVSFLSAPEGKRVALRSVNGARLSGACDADLVVCGCLRNADAVSRFVSSADGILVVPAGERWSDGSLRPCLEDLLGAGAVVNSLPGERTPEAELAARAFASAREELERFLFDSASGQELSDRGFSADIELAAELNVSDCVPVLVDGAYVRAGD